jgi:hypothetical protein
MHEPRDEPEAPVRTENVSSFLDGLSCNARAIVAALRAVVLEIVPDAAETMLWGTISYHTPWIGGRVKGALCQISVRRDAVRLEFIHGIRLADPSRILRGTALSKRYVPIGSVDEARHPSVGQLIADASAIDLDPPF